MPPWREKIDDFIFALEDLGAPRLALLPYLLIGALLAVGTAVGNLLNIAVLILKLMTQSPIQGFDSLTYYALAIAPDMILRMLLWPASLLWQLLGTDNSWLSWLFTGDLAAFIGEQPLDTLLRGAGVVP